MSQFTFKKSAEKFNSQSTIQQGVYPAVIVQVANIGLQQPYDRSYEPEPQMAVAFELKNGEIIAKKMKFSDYPQSNCYSLFTAAFSEIHEDDDQEIYLNQLLGQSVLIEVSLRDDKWPYIREIMPLENGFETFEPLSELMDFDAEDIDREVFLKLNRDIRSWVSKRIRHSS